MTTLHCGFGAMGSTWSMLTGEPATATAAAVDDQVSNICVCVRGVRSELVVEAWHGTASIVAKLHLSKTARQGPRASAATAGPHRLIALVDDTMTSLMRDGGQYAGLQRAMRAHIKCPNAGCTAIYHVSDVTKGEADTWSSVRCQKCGQRYDESVWRCGSMIAHATMGSVKLARGTDIIEIDPYQATAFICFGELADGGLLAFVHADDEDTAGVDFKKQLAVFNENNVIELEPGQELNSWRFKWCDLDDMIKQCKAGASASKGDYTHVVLWISLQGEQLHGGRHTLVLNNRTQLDADHMANVIRKCDANLVVLNTSYGHQIGAQLMPSSCTRVAAGDFDPDQGLVKFHCAGNVEAVLCCKTELTEWIRPSIAAALATTMTDRALVKTVHSRHGQYRAFFEQAKTLMWCDQKHSQTLDCCHQEGPQVGRVAANHVVFMQLGGLELELELELLAVLGSSGGSPIHDCAVRLHSQHVTTLSDIERLSENDLERLLKECGLWIVDRCRLRHWIKQLRLKQVNPCSEPWFA